MKSKEEFKKRFTDGEFDELLKNVSSPEDVVKIANDLGYELTVEDILSSELNEDMLSLVAGGKNETYVTNNINTYTKNTDQSMTMIGDNNKQMKAQQ